MKREAIVFILLISAFLAIGCTGYNSGQQTTTPVNETTAAPTGTTPVAPTNATTNGTSAAPMQGKIIEVSIQNFAFEPSSVTISAGDTVKWKNLDSVAHTIKGTDFASEALNSGDSFSHTFTQAGTYDYHCSIHPSMTGVVIVK